VNKRLEMAPELSNQFIEMEAEVANLEDKVSRLETTVSELLRLLGEVIRNDPNVNFQTKYVDRMVLVRDRWIRTA